MPWRSDFGEKFIAPERFSLPNAEYDIYRRDRDHYRGRHFMPPRDEWKAQRKAEKEYWKEMKRAEKEERKAEKEERKHHKRWKDDND